MSSVDTDWRRYENWFKIESGKRESWNRMDGPVLTDIKAGICGVDGVVGVEAGGEALGADAGGGKSVSGVSVMWRLRPIRPQSRCDAEHRLGSYSVLMASGSMSPAPAPAPRRDDPPCGGGGDGGVTGGGLNRPSEPSGSKTPSWHECGDRLVTSSKSSLTPAPEPPRCTDLDDSNEKK